MKHYPVVIVGAGPAGLTAAYELSKREVPSLVIEQADKVGGISRTETYQGYRFDIGGHRFFTKVEEVQKIWQEILGDEFIKVPRLSRIYYRGKFYSYPLSIFNALSNLGVTTSVLILLSYLKARFQNKFNRGQEPETFEEWVIDRFGERLYRIFFKTYTEKVWGIPCNEIRADWAAQRIQGMSLKSAVINALFGSQNAKSLIKEFNYPRLGPGMMWERCQEILEGQGSPVHLNTRVTRIDREGMRIKQVTIQQGDRTMQVSADHFISSMPVTALLRCLHPAPPDEVLQAARSLKYRDFLIVSLMVNRKHLFPDNWIYVHSPEFKVGRIQNFKNWSPAMVPDADKTCLGMEYFCNEGETLWQMADDKLIELATQEAIDLGLGIQPGDVEDGVVIRQRKAYPVYDAEYRQHLQVIQDYLEAFDNLQTVGRNGMHRYNNQDHSMLTAVLAVRNLLGEEHDLWTVNTERSYHEDFVVDKQQAQSPGQMGVQPSSKTQSSKRSATLLHKFLAEDVEETVSGSSFRPSPDKVP